ncbi:transposase [Thermoleptolyngbya sichuanensis A183]|uniref:Transposase n=1 Tax=Thermoleptolyngbya sichuanensis A183 TaxID=2737172 RepID=A0A6M8B444_9CYAN|nr:transposase [Thermoleptolyngbya sichuanensis]QKD80782.1 transposase [Thermoleptolyngbya sichuanensis A183]
MNRFITLGLDVSKSSATYCLLSELPENPKTFASRQRPKKIEATEAGRAELLALKFEVAILEPTGAYSRIWRHWLRQAGREYRLVGHWELKSYREGWKFASKTDKLDAIALAMYGLERRDRPGAFLLERDTTLSDLVLLHSHLNRQKNGFQNNLRQRLTYEAPELAGRRWARNWGGGVPGALRAIAGEPTPKWERELSESVGTGIGVDAAALARILIAIEVEEIAVEQAIEAELEKPQYDRYMRAAAGCGFSLWLSANLIGSIYPFEQFLEGGRRRIVHQHTRENNVRVRKDESLRAFKLACGMGLVWVQSGDWEGYVAGGNGAARTALRNSVASAYLLDKKAQKQGGEGDSDFKLVKHKYDNKGYMAIARRWIERYYKALVIEFGA